MINVLVTSIGSFSSEIVIKNIKVIGNRVVGTDIYPKELIAEALYVDSFYQVSKSDSLEFKKTLLDIVYRERIDLIIPLTDIDVDFFNSNRDAFKKSIICFSNKNVIDICRNKMKMIEFLKKSKELIQGPPTWALNKFKMEKLDSSFLCKPYDGRSSNGIVVTNKISEVKELLESELSNKYIIQPYIEGQIVCVDVIRDDRFNHCYAMPREELIRTPKGAGLSVKIICDDFIIQNSIKIAERLNIKGCVCFEFIKDKEGKYYFLECNPRFSGGIAFSCIAGYDFIGNTLKIFEGKEICKMPELKEQFIVKHYQEVVTCRM